MERDVLCMKDRIHVVEFYPVKTSGKIEELCAMAEEIWHEHFTPIIGAAQVEYMVEKFQSVPAITEQIANGYEYYLFLLEGRAIGYTGIHAENGELFLSKLYLRKENRGKGYARQAMNFLEDLCRQRGLSKIWLTVNRYNSNTIAAYKAMGLVTVREQKADIGNGFFMDDYIMEKPIAR